MKLLKCNKIKLFRMLIRVMVVGICIPSFLAVSEAIFRTDDFANYNTLAQANGSNYLSKCFFETIRMYKEWQGTYMSSFLIALCNPLRIYSYTMLHIILSVVLFLAIVSLVFLVKVVVDYCKIDKDVALYMLAMILLPIFAYREYQEVYLWYTGAIAYLLPAAFCAFGVAFLLRGSMTKKKIYYILSAIFMLSMAGGVLEVVGVGTFLLLWLIVVEYCRKQIINKGFIVVFLVTLAGALCNTCAPGNFVRHNAIDESKISFFMNLVISIKATLEEIEILLRSTTFLIFIFLAFLLGINLKKQVKIRDFVIFLVGTLAMPVVTAFPVVMGYSATGIVYFGNRCLFVIDVVIYGSLISSAILLGNQLSIMKKLPDIKTIYFVCGIAILISATTQGDRITNSIPMKIMMNYQEGVIQSYSNRWIRIFDEIQSSDEDDVVIVAEKPDYVNGCSDTELESDRNSWINSCVATYFGKKSVCLIEETN